MYEEEMEKVEVDDVIVEEETTEHEGFGTKIKRHWSNFVNDPVSGTKKIGLIVGALILGSMVEKHNSRKDRELLNEEITQTVVDQNGRETGDVVKMKKRDVIEGINKTHYVNIQPIRKQYSYKEFKKKK